MKNNIGDINTYNNIDYKIIQDNGLGFRKKSFVAVNCLTNELVTIFIPSITKTFNDIEFNKLQFKNDIDELLNIYNLYPNKCKIIPIYTSKDDLVIITKFIKGSILYKYLCDSN